MRIPMDYKRQTFPATDGAFDNLDRVCTILKNERGLKKYEIVSAAFELLNEQDHELIERAEIISQNRKQMLNAAKQKKEKLLSLLDKLDHQQIENLISGLDN
jgi:hypothetical protein